MVKKEHLLIAGGAAAVGVGALLLLFRRGKAYLTIAPPLSGTTDPPPGIHEYNVGETVQIQALPDSSNPYIQGWTVDGASKGTDSQIFVTMNKDHRVTVTFTSDNPQPNRIPAAILNLTAEPPASISLKQPYQGYWEIFAYPNDRHRQYHICPYDMDNDILDRFTYTEVQFKVVDYLGQPVANAPIAVHVAQTNDYNDGRLYIADTPSSPTNPILLYSDAQGIIKVPVAYHQELIGDFCKEHMLFERWYWFGAGYDKVCIQLGTDYFINLACTDIKTNPVTASCPECMPLQQCIYTEEFETAPTYNIITAYYTENPNNVKNYCQFSTWFGIKHIGDSHETPTLVIPPNCPTCWPGISLPVYFIDEESWQCVLLNDMPGPVPSCSEGQFLAYSEANGLQCLPDT